jgi:hypothetical protein
MLSLFLVKIRTFADEMTSSWRRLHSQKIAQNGYKPLQMI